jgi:hypothetical protein
MVEDDGKARPDGGNGVVSEGGGPRPGLENDIYATATISQVQNKKNKFKIFFSILKFYFNKY